QTSRASAPAPAIRALGGTSTASVARRRSRAPLLAAGERSTRIDWFGARGELRRAVAARQLGQRSGRAIERHPRPLAVEIGEQHGAVGVAAQRAHGDLAAELGDLGLALAPRVDP